MPSMRPVDPTDARGGDPWSWGTPRSWVSRGWPLIAAAVVVILFPNASLAWYVTVGLVGLAPIAIVQIVHSRWARARGRCRTR